ncbi:MAG TPA: hypothetical protein VM184_06280 [Gaiellaceae bacterium]|nr:hypothetical protein [Gaiellaceae bacterium]
MRLGIRAVDAALAVWAVAWLVGAAVTYSSLKQLEDGGRAVVAAGEGLDETSAGLRRAAQGLQETSDALSIVGELPFVEVDPGAAVARTATDVERFADRVSVTGRDARETGASARESAGTLAIVLGLAVALTPTLPALFLYLLLRPLVAQQLRRE